MPDTPVVLPFRGLLFDMDGVLVDSHAVIVRTWRRWAAMHGLDADALLARSHGRRVSDTLALVAPHLDIARETAWIDHAERHDFEGLCAVAGARALIASLDRDRWVLVTSSARDLAEARLSHAGLPFPRHWVTGDTITHGKPSPEGYQRGAAILALDPADCVVFEDAPPGIAAGRAAGAVVVGVATTYPAEDLPGAHVVVPDLGSVALHGPDAIALVPARGVPPTDTFDGPGRPGSAF